MRRLLAGIVIGVSATAVSGAAALTANSYWSHSTPNYKCEGYRKTVICSPRISNIHVMISGGHLMLYTGESNLFFDCTLVQGVDGCEDFR